MRNRISLIALALALAGIVVVGIELDWRRVISAWASVAWPWVIATALLNVFNFWVEALRWRTVLAASDVAVPTRTTFWGMLVGTVGNLVLPLKLGEAARAWAVARLAKAPTSTVVSTVVVDRLMDLTGLVALLIGVSLLVGPVAGVTLPDPIWLLLGVAGVFLVLILLAAGWRRFERRRDVGRQRPWTPHVKAFVRGLEALRQHHYLARATLWAVASWFTRVAVVWLMLAAFGLHWPVMQVAATVLIITLSIAVVALPGNLGTFELAASGALRLFGMPAETAVSFAIALHVTELLPTTLIGAFAIWRFGLRLERPTEPGEPAQPSAPAP